jgi:hypothetical protein
MKMFPCDPKVFGARALQLLGGLIVVSFPLQATDLLNTSTQTVIAETPGVSTPATPLNPRRSLALCQQTALLPAAAPEEIAALRENNAANGLRRYQVGIFRAFQQSVTVDKHKAPRETWAAAAGGWRTWSVAVSSSGALGLRIHLENLKLPGHTRLVVYDPKNPSADSSPVTAAALDNNTETWTPTLFSDQAVIECQVPPGTDMSDVSFTVTGVSHLYDVPVPSNLKEGTCHKDVTCYGQWANEASGVARISFIDGGNSYLCSGCLIATSTGDSIPYFLTANHCVGSQTVASTLELFWFYQTSRCNGTAPVLASVPHTSGGADLLSTATPSDYSFLKLRQSPPAGTFHLPWSTETPTSGEQLVGIHHPDGSYKRICFGTFIASDANFWAVRWYSGVTEPGSSGSPLLNPNHQIIGQLNGGWNGAGSSCFAPSSPDQYGRFDVTYPKIQRWVGGDSNPGGFTPPAGTYTGLFADAGNSDPQNSSGLITVTISSKSRLSGSLLVGSHRYGFKGVVDGNGAAAVSIVAGFIGQIDVAMQVDLSNPDHMSGTVTTGSFSAAFDAYLRGYDGRNSVAPQQGSYTMIISGSGDSGSSPGGDSFALVKIDKAGHVRISGSLADGTKFSQSASLGADGRWPFYVPLYSGHGSLFAWMTVSSGTVSGNVLWNKAPNTKSKTYVQGFNILRSATGSQYIRPPAGVNVLDSSGANVYFNGADLGTTFSDQVSIAANNHVTNLGPDRLSLKFSVSAGTFSGSVVNADSGRKLSFSGVILQGAGKAVGYFVTDGESGEVSILPF